MRLLKAMIQALALVLGTIAFSYLIVFLTKCRNLNPVEVMDFIVFICAIAVFTGLFYIDTDK